MIDDPYSGVQLGQYQLQELIGSGTFAYVYKGIDIADNTSVAVKILKIKKALSEHDKRAFLREVSTIQKLQHKHIIKLRASHVEGNIPYYSMPYTPYGSLRHIFQDRRLTLPTILTYVKQITSALQYAHDEHIIHRDVKPENLLLLDQIEQKGTIVLSDFGLAIEDHSTLSRGTQDDFGTVPYMAPEQFKKAAKPASDQYALGIIVYEWLSGERPFTGDNMALMYQHVHESPPPLLEKLPYLSPEIEKVIFRALLKEPDARYERIEHFAQALEQAISRHRDTRGQAFPVKAPTHSQSLLGIVTSIYQGHHATINTLAWSYDGGRIASGGDDQTIQVWRITSKGPLVTYRDHTQWIRCVAWSPNNVFIASAGAEGGVHVWQASDSVRQSTYTEHHDVVTCIAWSPEGKHLASGSRDNTVHVWDTTTGRNLVIYRGHQDWLRSIRWSSDGKTIFSVSRDGKLCLWNAQSGQELQAYYILKNVVVDAVAWSPSETAIALATRELIRIWNIKDGTLLSTHDKHENEVDTLKWSSDNKYIASGSKDHTVCIWEATTGKTLYTYRGHSDEIYDVAWSPDGSKLASGGRDGTVQVWRAQ